MASNVRADVEDHSAFPVDTSLHHIDIFSIPVHSMREGRAYINIVPEVRYHAVRCFRRSYARQQIMLGSQITPLLGIWRMTSTAAVSWRLEGMVGHINGDFRDNIVSY